jgi:hypothetical protein
MIKMPTQPTLREGWMYHEEPWETDPWTVGVDTPALYQFGLVSEDRGMNVPSKVLDISYTEVETYGKYYPTIYIGNNPADSVPTRYIMVNGIALYWLMGKAFEITLFTVVSATNFTVGDIVTGGTSNATGVILTISGTTFRVKVTSGTFQNSEALTNEGSGSTTINSIPVTDGKYITYFDGSVRKPRIAVWEQDANKKYHFFGVTPENLVLEFINGALSISLQSKGMKHGVDTDSPTFSFPGGIISAFTNIASAEWAGSSTVNIDLLQFRLNQSTTLKPIWDPVNGYYKDLNEFRVIVGTMNLQMESTQAELIISDMRTKTLGTLSYYIYKSNKGVTDNYIKVVADAYIVHEDLARDAGDPVTYNLVLVINNIHFEVKDGLALSFYQLGP